MRRRRPLLSDAKRLFSETLSEEMEAAGFDLDRYTREECEETVRACVERCWQESWDEFMLWVGAGDDRRERTRLLVQAMRVRDPLAAGRAARPGGR